MAFSSEGGQRASCARKGRLGEHRSQLARARCQRFQAACLARTACKAC